MKKTFPKQTSQKGGFFNAKNMMTELEEWRADQYKLVITAEGPKLVKKSDNGNSGAELDCGQEPAKPKKNGNGGVVLYWGANKPDNR